MGTETNLRKLYESIKNGKVERKPLKITPHISLSDLVEEKYIVQYKRPEDAAFKEIHVDDKQFQHALKYLQVSDEMVTNSIEKISSLGFGEKNARQVIAIVMRHNNPEKFFVAINNRIPINEFLKNTNVVEFVTTRYNLEPQLVHEILDFQPATQPSTGKGEAFMCLFVDGAKKGSSGDVEVNGKRFEVKGTGARLVGKREGFGDPIAAIKSFTTDLEKLSKKAKIPINFEGLNFSIGVNEHGAINTIAPTLLLSGKVTLDDIINVYVNGLHVIYQKANLQEVRRWISQSLNANGTINDKFHLNYYLFALQYYASLEDFDYLISIGTNTTPKILFGKMNWISKADIMSKNSNVILKRIIPAGWPSIVMSAGNQGAYFKIRPVV